MMRDNYIQLGVIGAMQRAHPGLTQLWLQWSGIPNLEWAAFDLVRPEVGHNPASQIKLSARKGLTYTWSDLCDTMSVPDDGSERRKMPIYLPSRHPGHSAFWGAMRKRELEEVDGPLEWWWQLMVLRFKGIQAASKALISEVLGEEESALMRGTVHLRNPSLNEGEKTAIKLARNSYRQPTHIVVSTRSKRSDRHDALAFSLSDATFKGRFVAALIDLAIRTS